MDYNDLTYIDTKYFGFNQESKLSKNEIKLLFVVVDYVFESCHVSNIDRCNYLIFLKNIFNVEFDSHKIFDKKWIKDKEGNSSELETVNYYEFQIWAERFTLNSINTMVRDTELGIGFRRSSDIIRVVTETKLFELLRTEYSGEKSKTLYKHIAIATLYDKKYHLWKVDFLNNCISKLNLPYKECISIAPQLMKSEKHIKHEMSSLLDGQKMMTVLVCAKALLISSDIIDSKEKKILNALIKDLGVRMPTCITWIDYVNKSASDLTSVKKKVFSEEKKEVMITIASMIITGDDDIDASEIRFLKTLQKRLDLKSKKLDFLDKYTGYSFTKLIKTLNQNEAIYALIICLDALWQDKEIHPSEERMVYKLVNHIQSINTKAQDIYYLLFIEFLISNVDICRKEKKFVQKIETIISKSVSLSASRSSYLIMILNFFKIYNNLKLKPNEVSRIVDCINVEEEDKVILVERIDSLSANQVLAEGLLLAFLQLNLILSSEIELIHHKVLGELIEKISFQVHNLKGKSIVAYLILKMLMLDGVMEDIEDSFFVKLMCHFGVSDSDTKKYLFLISLESGRKVVISDYLNYKDYKSSHYIGIV